MGIRFFRINETRSVYITKSWRSAVSIGTYEKLIQF